MWGLGFKYRVKGDAVQDSVMRFADYFRKIGRASCRERV